MITVTILINGQPVATRSAKRVLKEKDYCKYRMDDGNIIKHKPEKGAIHLAKLMLNKIKEI